MQRNGWLWVRGLAALAALGVALAWGCGAEPSPATPELEGMVVIPWGHGDFYIDTYEFPNRPEQRPLGLMTLSQSRLACETRGKRLCTAAEWRRACQGPEGNLRYGYGERLVPGRCNAGTALESGHTSMLTEEEGWAVSGAHPECRTPEGVYDLVGNFEEWVLDDWRGLSGMVEGGAWYSKATYSDCSGDYSRQPDYRLEPSAPLPSASARCCWSEDEPDVEDIARDAASRLGEAAAAVSTVPYDPANEVALADGLWMDKFEYPNRRGERPVVAVDWATADGLCAEAGKRLCEAQEWELACGGTGGWDYPYGNRYVPLACAVDLPEPVASGWHRGCRSPVGAFDLVGSVWEWTATPFGMSALEGEQGSSLREIHGGSWYVDPAKGRCRPALGYPAAPELAAFPDVGFRCCRGEQVVSSDPVEDTTVGCPDGMVGMDGFCIDRYEHPNLEGAIPASRLDFHAASAGCEARGLRSCGEREWLLACEGTALRRWPYGNVYQNGACLDESPTVSYRGPDLRASGAAEACRTPRGVFDLSGNLWEWVLGADGEGVLIGGGLSASSGFGQCRSRAAAQPGYASVETGTRCCQDAAAP